MLGAGAQGTEGDPQGGRRRAGPGAGGGWGVDKAVCYIVGGPGDGDILAGVHCLLPPAQHGSPFSHHQGGGGLGSFVGRRAVKLKKSREEWDYCFHF